MTSVLDPVDDRTDFQRKRDEILARLSYMIIIAAASVGLMLIWWMVEPGDVIEIDERPIQVAETYDASDKVITVPVELCKKLPLTAELRRSFIGETARVFLPVVIERLEPGCYETDVSVLIPAQVVPGKYTIKYETSYVINPIKTTHEQFETTPFVITE